MNEAIRILAKNLMILASAGSGKTYQLGNRVIGLVGARGVDPERIVALTFTRKAAGEFADSVLTKLAAAAAGGDGAPDPAADIGEDLAAGETLERIVRSLPRLQLTTLDGFFARVVRGFQYELGLTGGSFELIEGPRLTSALADIIGGILGDALGREAGGEFLHAFKRATAGKESQSVGRSLEEFFKDWHGLWKSGLGTVAGVADAFGPLPELGEWEQSKSGLAAGIERALTGTKWTRKGQDAVMGKLVDALTRHTIGSGSLGDAPDVFRQVVDWVADGGDGLVLKYYKEFEPGLEAAELLRETVLLLARCELAAAVGRTRAVGELVERYDGECERRLRRRGLLGFDDVKVLMGEWSRGEEARLRREAVDFRLDGRYDHWLLDEFQDTSPAEWTGIVPLIDEAAMGEDGSLFVVGDTKQAIYGWRGGDVRLFDEVREKYGAGDGLEVATMPESWRSCSEVLEMVNRVCGNREVIGDLFGPEVEQRWPWEDHVSARPQLRGEARVEVLKRDGRGGEERIERLVGLLGELRVTERQLSCGVLVRTNDQVRGVAERLRAEGIDVIEEGSRRPTEDNPVGVVMFHLLRWLADPADRFAREVVMMSPLWEVMVGRFGEAWQAAWEGLLAEAQRDGFAVMVEHLVESQWGGLSEFSRRRAGDVIGALAAFDGAGGGPVREALRWIDELEVAQSPGVAAVHVMTVHKAKGLGFDVVVLPEVEDSQVPNAGRLKVVRGENDGWLLQAPPGWVRQLVPELCEAEERWAADQRYEALCVLYVALTRAKRGLYVLLSEPPSSRKEAESFASPANWIAQALGAAGLGTVFQAGDAGWLDDVEQRGAVGVVTQPVLGAAVLMRARATPSGEEVAAGAGAGGSVSGMAFGSAVHAVFERVGWIEDGLDGLGSGEAAELVRDCLAVEEIAVLFRRRDRVEVWREQAIEVILDGTWVSGVIDRLLVERDENGRVVAATVIDFKTDRVDAKEELIARHGDQIAGYRRAIATVLGLAPGDVGGVLVSTSLRSKVELERS